METQDILNKPIGNIEPEKKTLTPEKITIIDVKVENVEKVKSDKVLFECKHPDREETINISSVSFIEDKNIVSRGTWVNIDKDGNLQKGSALTVLMNFLKIATLQEAKGKEIDTVLDGKYLTLKSY